jgi:hypothetical protein
VARGGVRINPIDLPTVGFPSAADGFSGVGATDLKSGGVSGSGMLFTSPGLGLTLSHGGLGEHPYERVIRPRVPHIGFARRVDPADGAAFQGDHAGDRRVLVRHRVGAHRDARADPDRGGGSGDDRARVGANVREASAAWQEQTHAPYKINGRIERGFDFLRDDGRTHRSSSYGDVPSADHFAIIGDISILLHKYERNNTAADVDHDMDLRSYNPPCNC